MLEFAVKGQTLTRLDDFEPATETKDYLTASFTFEGDDWAELTKAAIFKLGKAAYTVLIEEGKCKVPYEVLKAQTCICNKVGVTVFGVKGSVRATTNEVGVYIKPSGYVEGETPAELTPDLFAQYIDYIQADFDKVNENFDKVNENFDESEIVFQNMLAPYYLNLENISSLFIGKQIFKNLIYTSNASSARLCFSKTTGVKTAVVNLPTCTDATSLFEYSSVEEVTIQGTKFTNLNNAFSHCALLRVINFPNCSSLTRVLMIQVTPELEVVTIPSGSVKVSVMIPHSSKLTLESLTNIINGLADQTGSATKTLTIGDVNYSKLTPELIELALNKNWQIK